MAKFMQQVDDEMLTGLERLAKRRRIGVQELIRAVIIPDWMETEKRKAHILRKTNNGVAE